MSSLWVVLAESRNDWIWLLRSSASSVYHVPASVERCTDLWARTEWVGWDESFVDMGLRAPAVINTGKIVASIEFIDIDCKHAA